MCTEESVNKIVKHIPEKTYNSVTTPIITFGCISSVAGSVFAFNIIRTILFKKWGNFLSCVDVSDIRKIDEATNTQRAFLLKTELITNKLYLKSHYIIGYCCDLRFILAQLIHRYNGSISYNKLKLDIDSYITLLSYSGLYIKHEDMINNPIECIKNIGRELGIKINGSEIYMQCMLDQIACCHNKDYEIDYLTKPNALVLNEHQLLNWREELSISVQKQLIQDYGWWLEKHKYDTSF